jgi:capsular polysaccharide biosynthesis protein
MDEEISLREIIEVILNGKWVIISVTALALIITSIFTYVPQPSPVYRAEARIRIEQISQENLNSETVSYFTILITAMMNAERYNAEGFAELVKHPSLLSDVRQKLLLDERGISPGYLSRNLEISVDSSNTILSISLTHSDPDFAKSVVNTVSEEFKDFLSERQRERVDLLANSLERLISLELQGLQTSQSKLTEIRSSYEPLITYRDNSHLTPEYAVLSNDIANTQSQLAQLEAQQEEIKNFRVSVTSMIRSVDDWVIFTPASTATDVTPEPRLLNIAIVGILGLMISVMAVFFMNYWKESAPTITAR